MPTLDDDECRARIVDHPVARLATLRRDGTPRLIPMTFAVVGDVLACAVDRIKPKTDTRLARLRDIERDPRVALIIDHWDDDWSQLWWVRIEATAAEHHDGELRERALDALQEKYPPYRAERPDGVVIAYTPTAWSGWTAST